MDFSEAIFIVSPVSSALRGFRLSSSCCSDWFNAGVPDSETIEHGAWGSVLTPLALQHEIVMKRLSLEKKAQLKLPIVHNFSLYTSGFYE